MSNVLVLTSSLSGPASVSNQLVERTVAELRAANPGVQVTVRDLGGSPIPHLDGGTVAGVRAEPATDAERAARVLSDELVAELKRADTIVVGAPMYNFGIPSTLKTWFDYVLRAGVTFSYTEKGPVGLVEGKRAIVILSRGGAYSEGPAKLFDSQEPHLRTLFGFMGVTDVTFVRAESLAMAAEQSIADARATIAQVVAGLRKAA